MPTTSQHSYRPLSKKEVGKIVKQSLVYISLFILFRTVFVLIIPYYINVSPEMKGPIDARVADYKFFDEGYVKHAKEEGYKIAEYFQIYLPLDIVFPILYTIMFLTALRIFRHKQFYKPALCLVFSGMIFDYLENFTFSVYLESSTELSVVVAFFTTIKTFLFLLNSGVFVFTFIGAAILFFTGKEEQENEMTIPRPHTS